VHFVACLALSLAGALGLAGDAWAVTYGPTVKATGAEQTVFHYTTDHCSSDAWDIPDQPARAFRDDQNPPRVHLHFDIATNTVYRNIGTSLDDASKSVDAGQGSRHDCANPVTISGGNPDPSKFDNYEWLTSFYTLDGHTVYSVAHEEWRGWQAPQPYYCPLAADNDTTKCWYNALVLYTSTNSGDRFDRYPCCPPPTHLLASVPHQWVNQQGPYGVFQPSNIIRKQPDDGYLYSMIRAKEPGKADVSCLMRTQATDQALANPTSWRAWGDGPDADSTDSFEVQFVNPYTYTFSPSDPASAHMCKGIGSGTIGAASESLTYNTYYGKYMLIGVRGAPSPGFYYSLSDDLINWSPTQTLLERETQFSYQCGDPDPVIAPSLLDATSTSRNFETVGRDAYLYYALFHPDQCGFGPNRDLQRVPIKFSKAPNASFTVSPNPASTGQTVTFNASASTDVDGTIAKYEWDLDGNGSFETDTGTTLTTTHSYSVGGTVAVKVRVTDNDGAWSDATRNLTITSTSNQAPTASFTPSPNPALSGQAVTFNGSASSDPEGPIANYQWDLDGNGSFETDTGTTPTTSYSYATPGTLTVKLRVTDSGGAANDASRTLTIDNRPPTASFNVSPSPAVTGQNVIFNGSGSIDLDGTITNYKWDLDGNGSFEADTGTTSTASHSYDVPGTVTVKLRVTDSSGATNDTSRVLTVNASNGGPVASLSIAPNPAQAGETVRLDGSSSSAVGGTITKYEWDLNGDASFETDTGSTTTASYSYATAGTLTLQLRVTDNNGMADATYGILTIEGSLPDPVPAPIPAPIQAQTPTAQPQTTVQTSCTELRKKRIARLTRLLKNARRGLARAHTRAAKRAYRAKVKSLTKRLKRQRKASC
jgi:PKD repeat protein